MTPKITRDAKTTIERRNTITPKDLTNIKKQIQKDYEKVVCFHVVTATVSSISTDG